MFRLSIVVSWRATTTISASVPARSVNAEARARPDAAAVGSARRGERGEIVDFDTKIFVDFVSSP
jgi:hypothetical protein